MKCDICDLEFDNYRALNGHKRMHGNSNGTRVCKTPYKNSKPDKHCLNCDTVISKRNKKFCSLTCQTEHERNVLKEKILADTLVSTKTLKKFLFEIEEQICSECGMGTIWNGKELILQMDHIDGDPTNNVYSNVRILCPNCHTQTLTWGYKLRDSDQIKT